MTEAQTGVFEAFGQIANQLFDGGLWRCWLGHIRFGGGNDECDGESITLIAYLPVESRTLNNKTQSHCLMGPKKFIVAIVMAVALSAGIFIAARLQAPAEVQTAYVLPAATPLPDFALLDQDGNEVTPDTFRDHWDLVFFGFTHCPDICPATLQILSAAREELSSNGQSPLPRIVLVSVDPERDTPELLAKYVAYFGDDNLGVTGSLEETRKLTSALGIYFEKQPGETDNYSVDHSAAVLVVNPDAEFHALFGGTHRIENFLHDLPILMAKD